MRRPVCVFDAYGTLFDVAAAAREAAAEPGADALAAHWPRLAEIWREKQLSYTWLRTVTGAHCDFWQVTQDALDYALEALALDDADLRARLLALYRRLSAYPEVPQVLEALRAAGHPTAILSNGSEEMLADALAHAGIGDRLDAVLSVDRVGVFKPDARVYALVAQTFGAGEVLFVSANGWDAAAATGHGFTCAWVNRAGLPMERLPWRPAHVLADLTGVPGIAAA